VWKQVSTDELKGNCFFFFFLYILITTWVHGFPLPPPQFCDIKNLAIFFPHKKREKLVEFTVEQKTIPTFWFFKLQNLTK